MRSIEFITVSRDSNVKIISEDCGLEKIDVTLYHNGKLSSNCSDKTKVNIEQIETW
ncbi:MAG: hypothetical protein OHK0017_11760 [Patescibacteria group bacterium]